jgi:ribosomal protein S12 methylthiotransferase accessory factor
VISPHLSQRRLSDILPYLVDDLLGIVSDVGEVPRDAGAPEFFHYYARACDTRAFTAQKNYGDTGGASINRWSAMAKAVGEAVERYSAAIYDKNSLPLCSFSQASFPCVDPGSFALYSAEQCAEDKFPYSSFNADTPVRWIAAIDLTDGHMKCVPAAMTFVPYYYDREASEPPIVQPISTGLACHCSFEEAAIAALCEVIERDAFMITWQAGLSRPHIIKDTLSRDNQDCINRFERVGDEIIIVDLRMDHAVPTTLAILRNTATDAPRLVFAAASHPDPELAVRKSLEELAHTRRHAQNLTTALPAFSDSPPFNNILSQGHHVRFYCNPRNEHWASFIFECTDRVDFNDIPSMATGNPATDLRFLVQQIVHVGHRALLVDLTTADIQDLGLKVVRVIIPGFQPLYMGHRLRALGGARLPTLMHRMTTNSMSESPKLNLAPHPYP